MSLADRRLLQVWSIVVGVRWILTHREMFRSLLIDAKPQHNSQLKAKLKAKAKSRVMKTFGHISTNLKPAHPT